LGAGIEANPLTGRIIDRHGWWAVAEIRFAALAAASRSWSRWPAGRGRGRLEARERRTIAATVWVNALRDVFVLPTGIVLTVAVMRLLGVF